MVSKRLQEIKKEMEKESDEKKEERIVKCPDCGCEEFVYDKGERFCKRCGLVLESPTS